MICPECNGRGETIYYVEIDRDENTVTVEQKKVSAELATEVAKSHRPTATKSGQ